MHDAHAQHSSNRPYGDSDVDQPATIDAIRKGAEEKPKYRESSRESQTSEDAELHIGDAHVAFDRVNEQGVMM